MSLFDAKWSTVCRTALFVAVTAAMLPAAELVAADASATATKVLLTSGLKAGSTATVEVGLQVGGEVLLTAGGAAVTTENKIKRLPMSVAAKLQYEEQILATRNAPAGTARAGRRYTLAKAVVEIDKHKQQPRLNPQHTLIAAEQSGTETTLFSPGQKLSRESLDLIDVTANSLVLDDLLPNRQVKLGESWANTADQLAALLRLDAVSLVEVQSLLAAYDAAEGLATISMAGTIHGAIGGVATEIEIKSKYQFDTQSQRIVRFTLLFKEKRSIGHVGPGLDVTVKQLVVVKPLPSAKSLTTDDLTRLAIEPDDAARQLELNSQANGFRIEHGRSWFVTSDERKLTVLRYLDRGELVGQCNLTPLDPITSAKDLTLAGFQSDIEKSLGDRFSQFAAAKESTDSQNRRVYRVVAQGKVADLSIQWIYYLLTAADGRRLSVAFSIEQSLVERFGNADEALVNGIEIIAPTVVESAKSETPKQR